MNELCRAYLDPSPLNLMSANLKKLFSKVAADLDQKLFVDLFEFYSSAENTFLAVQLSLSAGSGRSWNLLEPN
jgi:hypothetical protein